MADGDPFIQGQSNTFTETTYLHQARTNTNTLHPAVYVITDALQQALIAVADSEALVGQSNSAPAVVGISFGDDSIHGEGTGTYSGVFGNCDDGSGVRGSSNTAQGVMGQSLTGVGVWGEAAFQGGIGVVGAITPNLGVGAPGPATLAGVFLGDTEVKGRLFVGKGKHAAIPQRDGSHLLLYSMESPECWFEDFGRAKLTKGRAKVRLAKDFAGVIRLGTHFVFLTPEGNCNGLYIHAKTKTGFEVRELQGGKSKISFSYRVVAKRKDLPDERFPKIKLPKLGDLRRPVRKVATKRVYQRPDMTASGSGKK